jgi:hypothetical protein
MYLLTRYESHIETLNEKISRRRWKLSEVLKIRVFDEHPCRDDDLVK